MKARVKITGEIVFVEANLGYPGGYVASNGNTYLGEELEVIVECEPDYWARLEHQYAGMAMQGILSNQDYCKLLIDENNKGSFAEDVSRCASEFAHALVEKYKKEERK